MTIPKIDAEKKYNLIISPKDPETAEAEKIITNARSFMMANLGLENLQALNRTLLVGGVPGEALMKSKMQDFLSNIDQEKFNLVIGEIETK